MAESNAVTTLGIGVYIMVDGVKTELMEVKSVPELGTNPSKLEATHLKNHSRVYKNGISDNGGDLPFVCNAIPRGSPGSNIDLVESLSKTRSYQVIVEMPQINTLITWWAQISGRYSASAVDAIQEFVVNTTPTSDITDMELDTEYTVTYESNAPEGAEASGTPTEDTATYPAGSEAEVMECTETVEGYRFLGWSPSQDGQGKLYAPGETVLMTSDIVLYAQWLAEAA